MALLYNAPRAASIFAKSDDCVCWVLDRETFNGIVKEASIKRREKFHSFLKGVELLKQLNEHEINQICDAIRVEKYSKGQTIIQQGEIGDKFFLLEDGSAVAYKIFEGSNEEKEVMRYKSGEFFGELALMRGEPRAATVKANLDCTFLSLERGSFKRLLGPLETLLKHKADQYKKH